MKPDDLFNQIMQCIELSKPWEGLSQDERGRLKDIMDESFANLWQVATDDHLPNISNFGTCQVAVGYPGMMRNDPAKWEDRPRKIITSPNQLFAIMWADPDDIAGGFNLVNYNRAGDELARVFIPLGK